jgi:Fic family protein
MEKQPVLNSTKAVALTSLTLPTVLRSFKEMERLGLIQETTGRERGRMYAYISYLTLLNHGTEPFKY